MMVDMSKGRPMVFESVRRRSLYTLAQDELRLRLFMPGFYHLLSATKIVVDG